MKGRYVKYANKVLEVFCNGKDALIFAPLLKLLVEHMEEVCEMCMENKMVCTLRPMCPERRWLSFLIMIGAQKEDLPAFCFKTRINEVKAIIERTSHIHFSDAILQIDVFLNILSGGRSRLIEPFRSGDLERFIEGLEAEFKRHTKNISLLVNDRCIFILVDENLVMMYLDKGFVLINPEEKVFDSAEELVNLVLAFKNHYDVPIQVEEEFAGFPRITVRIPHKPYVEDLVNKFVEKMVKNAGHVNFFPENDSLMLEVEFDLVNSPLKFRKVLHVLNDIKSLYQEVIGKGEGSKT
ncbi:MAG: hypothetical protein QXK94_00645 [Candidatus Jordarchaeales archaeon]